MICGRWHKIRNVVPADTPGRGIGRIYAPGSVAPIPNAHSNERVSERVPCFHQSICRYSSSNDHNNEKIYDSKPRTNYTNRIQSENRKRKSEIEEIIESIEEGSKPSTSQQAKNTNTGTESLGSNNPNDRNINYSQSSTSGLGRTQPAHKKGKSEIEEIIEAIEEGSKPSTS